MEDKFIYSKDEDFEDGLKSNSRKSLLGGFVRSILKDHSNYRKPLNQEKIMALLDQYPYCLSVNRKTLGRELESLMDAYPEICRTVGEGYYYDRMGRAA